MLIILVSKVYCFPNSGQLIENKLILLLNLFRSAIYIIALYDYDQFLTNWRLQLVLFMECVCEFGKNYHASKNYSYLCKKTLERVSGSSEETFLILRSGIKSISDEARLAASTKDALKICIAGYGDLAVKFSFD